MSSWDWSSSGRATRTCSTRQSPWRNSPFGDWRPTALAVVSEPIEGDTYKRDETIEVAITFGDRVLVAGTPQLALSVGTNARTANYVRGSNSNRLVFEYTVSEADRDGHRDRAGRGNSDGVVRRAGLEAGRRGRPLQNRARPSRRGHLYKAGHGDGDAHTRPFGGHEHTQVNL